MKRAKRCTGNQPGVLLPVLPEWVERCYKTLERYSPDIAFTRQLKAITELAKNHKNGKFPLSALIDRCPELKTRRARGEFNKKLSRVAKKVGRTCELLPLKAELGTYCYLGTNDDKWCHEQEMPRFRSILTSVLVFCEILRSLCHCYSVLFVSF